MFKKLVTSFVAVMALALAGCSNPYSVEQTSYGVPVDSGKAKFNEMVVGQNLKLSSACMNNCEKGWIFQLPIHKATYNGNYTLPLSEKLELTVGMTVIFEFDRSGGRDTIVNRLKQISERYSPTSQSGSAGSNMALYWNIASIANYDLPIGRVKSIVRPILATKTLDDAADELAALGPIVDQIEDELREYLVSINSTLKVREIQFHQIDLPDSVKLKNEQNYNLKAQEDIQGKQLVMREKRILTTHKLNLTELKNELELDALLEPTLTDSKLAYKWIQTANLFAENGIPFATTAEMLAPATGKVYDASYDTTRLMDTINRKLNEVEQQIKKEQACAETEGGCSN